MDTPWIVAYPARHPVRLRLLCFPYAGAGASIFRPWAAGLPPDVELWALQLPGRERRWREPLVTSFPPLLADLTSTLLPWLDTPFALYGHSVGAMLAFALARSLQQQQAPMPLQVIVSGRLAPQYPALRPSVVHLSDADLIEELRRYQGTPDAVLESASLMQLILPILRADLTLNETYHDSPAPPLPCPIAIFGGKDDELTHAEGLAAWQHYTASEARLYWFDGGHFFLKTAQAAVLATITDLLRIAS